METSFNLLFLTGLLDWRDSNCWVLLPINVDKWWIPNVHCTLLVTIEESCACACLVLWDFLLKNWTVMKITGDCSRTVDLRKLVKCSISIKFVFHTGARLWIYFPTSHKSRGNPWKGIKWLYLTFAIKIRKIFSYSSCQRLLYALGDYWLLLRSANFF